MSVSMASGVNRPAALESFATFPGSENPILGKHLDMRVVEN
jgi:hypothetical protein